MILLGRSRFVTWHHQTVTQSVLWAPHAGVLLVEVELCSERVAWLTDVCGVCSGPT